MNPGGGCGASSERTANIQFMSVTPEVCQLEMSALKYFKSLKRLLMSEMAETSQSATAGRTLQWRQSGQCCTPGQPRHQGEALRWS